MGCAEKQPILAWKRAGMCLSLLVVACAPQTDPETFSGYYRQGFEQSDFYTKSGDGPYWLEANEAVSVELQEYVTPYSGRGRAITVKLTVEGSLDRSGGFGSLDRYPVLLTATKIFSVEALPEEEWDRITAEFRADDDD